MEVALTGTADQRDVIDPAVQVVQAEHPHVSYGCEPLDASQTFAGCAGRMSIK